MGQLKGMDEGGQQIKKMQLDQKTKYIGPRKWYFFSSFCVHIYNLALATSE